MIDTDVYRIAETLWREAGPVIPGAWLVLYSMASRVVVDDFPSTLTGVTNGYSAVRYFSDEEWDGAIGFWIRVEKEGASNATERILTIARIAAHLDKNMRRMGMHSEQDYLITFQTLVNVGLSNTGEDIRVGSLPLPFAMGGGLDVERGSGAVTGPSIDGTIELFLLFPGKQLREFKGKQNP